MENPNPSVADLKEIWKELQPVHARLCKEITTKRKRRDDLRRKMDLIQMMFNTATEREKCQKKTKTKNPKSA